LLRPPLLAAAAPAAIVDWLRRPATLGRPRKRLAKAWRDARKRWQRTSRDVFGTQ
jgi:hypothetical protein